MIVAQSEKQADHRNGVEALGRDGLARLAPGMQSCCQAVAEAGVVTSLAHPHLLPTSVFTQCCRENESLTPFPLPKRLSKQHRT